MNLSAITDKLKNFIPGQRQAVSQGPAISLACDIGQSKVTFLELERNNGSIQVSKFHKMPRPEKLADGLRECIMQQGFSTANVRISIKGHGVIVRFIQFPKMELEELRGAMTYEAEKYIPFKADEVIVDYHILDTEVAGADQPTMNILLVAVKRDEVYGLIQAYQDAGLIVELVDIDALAYLNALEFSNPETSEMTVATLDLGNEISTLCVSQKGKPRFIRDISFGSVDILKRLKRKLGLSDEEASKVLEDEGELAENVREVLKEAMNQLANDVKVSLDYYLDQVASPDPVTKLFIGGGRGSNLKMQPLLSEEFEFSVEIIDVLEKVVVDDSLKAEMAKSRGALPVAFGLALRNL